MKQNISKNKLLIGLIIFLVVGILIALFFIYNLNEQKQELEQDNIITKQQLEDEYETLSMQYEGFKITIKNDSLLEKLTGEQLKVQNLLDELKTVKDSNKREINRLNKELTTLRQVMRTYIIQIDSLNRANESLRKENKEISTRYKAVQQDLKQVSKQKENLTEKVNLASKLDAVAITMSGINNKGKAQKKINKMDKLEIGFTIAKNITAEPGEKSIYVRIMKPDDDILIKSRTDLFPFENRDIAYSIKKDIEYTGEEITIQLYWDIEEYLMPGTYRVDVFADGSRIGSKRVTLED